VSDRWRDLSREAMLQIQEFIVHLLRDTSRDLSSRQAERKGTALRRLLRRSTALGGPGDLETLSGLPAFCGEILRETHSADARDVSEELQTLRGFLFSRLPWAEAERRMAAIEEHLIPRRTRDWHQAERVPGGRPVNTKRAPLLLFFDDLLAVSAAARQGKQGERAQRDGTLVDLVCFSPLRSREIVELRWEQLLWQTPGDDVLFGAWARCARRDVELLLPIHRRASDALAVLYALTRRVMDREPKGPVFRSMRHPYLPLDYRDVKAIIDRALEIARLSGTTRRDLLAAYAYHLKTAHGFTDPDLRETLGYGEVKHVRFLLQAHESWELNRKADAAGGPIPGWN